MDSSIFVRIDRYKEVYELIKQIKAKLEDAKQGLKGIMDIKGQEDAEIGSWQNELMVVEQKLAELSQEMAER